MKLRLFEYIHQEVDYQLTITKHPDGISEGKLFPDNLGQALEVSQRSKLLASSLVHLELWYNLAQMMWIPSESTITKPPIACPS